MVNELDVMSDDTIILLERVEFNLLLNGMKEDDSRRELYKEVERRVIETEKKHGKSMITIPITVSETKKLFPKYKEHPPLWWNKSN